MTQTHPIINPEFQLTSSDDAMDWFDVRGLHLQGQGWPTESDPFTRLPSRAKVMVRDPVWEFSRHSAGLYVRFATDSPIISVQWKLQFPKIARNHMPARGASGVDLYCRDESWHNGRYRWCGSGGSDQFPDVKMTLREHLPPRMRQHIIYLPLFNGVETMSLGIKSGAKLSHADPWRGGIEKPVCFYGTSIVHGACASHAGMAYPSILGRLLEVPTINLGFSGNGQCEPQVADLLCELDPSVFVIDPMPNTMAPERLVNYAPLVRKIAAARPRTPLILVEHLGYQQNWLDSSSDEAIRLCNEAVNAMHQELLAANRKDVWVVPGQDLCGSDSNGTADGVHPTDLGFHRITQKMEPVLRAALAL